MSPSSSVSFLGVPPRTVYSFIIVSTTAKDFSWVKLCAAWEMIARFSAVWWGGWVIRGGSFGRIRVFVRGIEGRWIAFGGIVWFIIAKILVFMFIVWGYGRVSWFCWWFVGGSRSVWFFILIISIQMLPYLIVIWRTSCTCAISRWFRWFFVGNSIALLPYWDSSAVLTSTSPHSPSNRYSLSLIL